MDLGRDSPVLCLQASIQLGQHYLEAIRCNLWPSGRDTTSDLGQNSTPPPLSSFVLQSCFFGSRCTGWLTRSVRISTISPYTPLGKLQGPCFGDPHAQTVEDLSADSNNWIQLFVPLEEVQSDTWRHWRLKEKNIRQRRITKQNVGGALLCGPLS